MIATRSWHSQRGIVAIATLIIFLFIMGLATAMMTHNAAWRHFLRDRRDGGVALANAESGAQVALHRLAAGDSQRAFEQPIGVGKAVVTLEPAGDLIAITSTGIARSDDPHSLRKTVRVEARIAGGRPQVVAWRIE